MPLLAREGRDPLGLVPIEHLTRQAPDRTLDHDRADVGRDAAAGRARQHRLDVGLRECGPAGRKRHQRQARQRLARIAGVVVDVAHLRHDHAALRPGERAQGQLVGERARRHEHRRLLAEQLRPVLLELLDLSAKQVVVVFDVLVLAQPIEQRGVLARRDADAVARSVHNAIGLDGGVGEHRRVRKATGADDTAQRSDESATRDRIHGYFPCMSNFERSPVFDGAYFWVRPPKLSAM